MDHYFEYSRIRCLVAGVFILALYGAFLWVLSPFIPERFDLFMFKGLPGYVMVMMFIGVGAPVFCVSGYLAGLKGVHVGESGVSVEHLFFPDKMAYGNPEHMSMTDMGNDSWVFSFSGGRFGGMDTGYHDVGDGQGSVRFYGMLATDEARMDMSDFAYLRKGK